MFWKKTNDNTVKEWTENSLAAQAKLAAVKILWTEMMAKEPQSLISPMQIDQASMLDLWISIRLGSFTGWFDNNYEFDVAQTADLTKQVELMAPLCNRVGRHRWNKKTKELNSIVTFQYKALLNWGFEVGEKTSSDNYLFKKLNNVENVNFFLEGFFQKLGDELIKWQVFHLQLKHSHHLNERPKTIFEILFEDVTLIAKRISLAAKFGTEPISLIERLVDGVKNTEGERTSDLLGVIAAVIQLDDPDKYKKS